MNVCRLRMIRLTASPAATKSRPPESRAAICMRVTQPVFGSRSTRRSPPATPNVSPARRTKAVSHGVVSIPHVRHGKESVAIVARSGDVGRLTRTILRSHAPRAVAHADAVDRNLLTVQHEFSGHAAELVEVVCIAERGTNRGKRLRRHHAFELQARLQPIAVVVAERVTHARFEHSNRNAGRQLAVVEILIVRQLQRRVVRRIQCFPRQVCAHRPRAMRRRPPCRCSAAPSCTTIRRAVAADDETRTTPFQWPTRRRPSLRNGSDRRAR